MGSYIQVLESSITSHKVILVEEVAHLEEAQTIVEEGQVLVEME